MYTALLGVAVDAYLFTHDKYSSQFKFISYEDNIIPKLIFWPDVIRGFNFLFISDFEALSSL